MSAEVSNFSKRAAAELSRCFNGITVSSSSSSSSSSTTTTTLKEQQQQNVTIHANHTNQIQMGTTQTLNSTTGSTSTSVSASNSTANSATMDPGGGSVGGGNNGHYSKVDSEQQPQPSAKSSSTSSTFGARSAIGGAFRVLKNNSEKILLSPLKSTKSQSNNQVAATTNEQGPPQAPQASMTSNTTAAAAATSASIGTANPNKTAANILPQQPKHQSRKGPPPPKAPPKTQRARMKNYLLNIRKPTKIFELFSDDEFLRRYFFPNCYHYYYHQNHHHSPSLISISSDSSSISSNNNNSIQDFCRLTQVCKKWYQILYSNDDYWKHLLFTINFIEMKQLKHITIIDNDNNVNDNDRDNDDDNRIKQSAKSSSLNNDSNQIFFKYLSPNNKDQKDNGTSDNGTTNDKLLYNFKRRLYYSLIILRKFQTICLQSASDNDLVELIDIYKNFIHNDNNDNDLQSFTHVIIRNSSITDNGLELFLQTFAKRLHSFELIGCNELSNSGLWSGLVPHLKLLTIQDCINVSDDTVTVLCQLLTSLQTLNFQAYHVTDLAMAYFSTSAMRQSLSVLTLQHCWEITNQGVANVAHSLPNLTTLSLSGCSKITDDAIEVVAEQLRNLTKLDLSWCPRISDASLEFIACDLADTLQTLVLDRCLHITDIGIGYLATMANLQHLSVRWCPQIRDFGLQALTSLRSLRTLSIAGCTHVTITGLSFIVRMRQLEEIELTNCPSATKELLKYLSESLPETCTIIT